jgi:NAD(P)-dependent dehydrogenase (short-subunit alcohol dehydrogenase family)
MAPKYNGKTTGTQLLQDLGDNIKDKIILITGVTPGSIGGHFALAVAKGHPRLLILAGRNAATTQQTADAIVAAHPDVATKTLPLDLSSFQAVRDAVAAVHAWPDVPRLDVLVNNAGIMAEPWAKTVDGVERQFAVNHLGHFLLTNLLMDKLLAAPAPRVVAVSSDGHRLSPIRWTDYNFGVSMRPSGWILGGQWSGF